LLLLLLGESKPLLVANEDLLPSQMMRMDEFS